MPELALGLRDPGAQFDGLPLGGGARHVLTLAGGLMLAAAVAVLRVRGVPVR